MKKTHLIGLVVMAVVVLAGCAQMKQIKDDAVAGAQDATIRTHAVAVANQYRDIATTAAAAVPVPWLPLAAGGGAWVIAFITTLIKDEQKHRHEQEAKAVVK